MKLAILLATALWLTIAAIAFAHWLYMEWTASVRSRTWKRSAR